MTFSDAHALCELCTLDLSTACHACLSIIIAVPYTWPFSIQQWQLQQLPKFSAGEVHNSVSMQLTADSMPTYVDCRYYMNGSCAKGPLCTFSHDWKDQPDMVS